MRGFKLKIHQSHSFLKKVVASICTGRYTKPVKTNPIPAEPSIEKNSASRILAAALEVFGAKGYEATSIREICERAGITRPTLYYFFESKEGLYRALVEEANREFHRTVTAALAASTDLRTQYKYVARGFFAQVTERPALVRFMYNLVWSTTSSPFAQELHKTYAEVVELMSAAARTAEKSGQISASHLEVRMIVLMGALGEAISCFLFLGTQLTPALADGIVDVVFDGWK